MRANGKACSEEGRECGGSRPRRVRIVRVDYERNELFDEEGNGYCELANNMWARFGAAHEGSVRYWGSGSHAGHINLLPAMQYRAGQWVSLLHDSTRKRP
mgnify:CR=1 FL=1